MVEQLPLRAYEPVVWCQSNHGLKLKTISLMPAAHEPSRVVRTVVMGVDNNRLVYRTMVRTYSFAVSKYADDKTQHSSCDPLEREFVNCGKTVTRLLRNAFCQHSVWVVVRRCCSKGTGCCRPRKSQAQMALPSRNMSTWLTVKMPWSKQHVSPETAPTSSAAFSTIRIVGINALDNCE